MDCPDKCLHIKISEEMLDQAKKDDENIRKQKGDNNPTTVKLSNNYNIIGSLAQNGVFHFLDVTGIGVDDRTEFYDDRISADEYDFKARNSSIDIKGSPIIPGHTAVGNNDRFLVKDSSKSKYVDYYCFVKVDLENDLLHIAGVLEYDLLWEKQFNGNMKIPCHFAYMKELKPFLNFILATDHTGKS